MINLKIAGAAVLLAITPVLMSSSADARPFGGGRGGGGGFHGGGMAFHGGGGAFRGGGAAFAARPGGGAAFAGRSFAAASPVGHNWNGGGHWSGGGHWGGGRHWNGHRWIGPGLGFAAGLAAGSALGYGYGDGYYGDSYAYYDDSAVAPEVTYEAAPADGDSVAYCQQTYRSYDPASGTYLGYDGLRHSCP